ncbi:MAG TPA: PAS domain S-box protein [Puia sp.]
MYLTPNLLLELFHYYGYRLGIFSNNQGIPLIALSVIIVTLGILWYNAVLLNKRDYAKQKTENDLRKSEEMFRLLVNSASDYAIFMVAKDGLIISWNEGAHRIKGYSADEIIGKHISIFYTKDEIEHGEPEYNLQIARTIGRFENQGWRVRKDGSVFWADIVFTAIYNDKKQIQGFAKITRDISERKKAEEKFRSLLEAAPDAMIFANEKGEIVLINHRTEIIFGYKKSEIIGQQIDILIPADLRGGHKAHRSNYFANPRVRPMGVGLELFALRKDGTRFPVEISLAPIITEEGTLVAASLRDITERKKLEEELKKLREQLEEEVKIKTAELTSVFERVSDGFMAFDNKGEITYVNKRAAELNKRTPEDLIGKRILVELDSTEFAVFHENFYQSITQQRNLHFEMYYSALGMWVENYMYPSPDGLSLFSRDITERKAAEERIIKEKEISDSIINSLPGIFYLFNINGKFLRWNNNFETISGYDAEEISQMSPIDFFDADEKSYIHERIEKVFADGMSDAEANFLSKNKEKNPYYFTGRSIAYEGETCLMGSGIDISLRNKREEEVRQSERKYKLLFEQNPMPMWILIPANNCFIDVNDSALNHYGYTRKEFLLLNTEKIKLVEDQNQSLKESTINIPGISYQGLERHQKKDGSVIYVETYSTDYIYEDKLVQLIISNDISEKINSEKNLKRSFEEIRQLASHLQNVREEERAGIAREIHDELGQQLTGLKMDISWIYKKIEADADMQIKQKINGTLYLLDSAIKTVRRIATDLRPSILDDLGLIAAIEWQSQEFEKRSGIVTLFESGITDFNFSPLMAIGLFRICQEALTNVSRYAEAKNVFISLQQKDEEILFTITDDGKGFDINKVGQKKTLGLLGMKERCQMMRGKFEIVSKQGEGTSVQVRISY